MKKQDVIYILKTISAGYLLEGGKSIYQSYGNINISKTVEECGFDKEHYQTYGWLKDKTGSSVRPANVEDFIAGMRWTKRRMIEELGLKDGILRW